jgi:5-methylcytosine-specific restriction endonuclease McrA
MSEGSAYNRIETARAARCYPKVLEALACGDLTLTAVRLLAPHLTPENSSEVLAAARHKSKQGIQELIASLNPRPAPATIIRRAVVTPLSPECYLLEVTLTRETHDKLRLAQALSRHTLPTGDVASILDRALTLLVDHLERRRFAHVKSPRRRPLERGTAGRHIPAAVRRAVWQRDEGRCALVGHTGRCRETAFLEFHHVAPYAAGGTATAENIQLRCRAHNQHEARLFFGETFVRERPVVYAAECGSRSNPSGAGPPRALREPMRLGLTTQTYAWRSQCQGMPGVPTDEPPARGTTCACLPDVRGMPRVAWLDRSPAL